MTRALAILLSFMPFAFTAQATEQVETKTELTPWYYGMGIGSNDFEYNYTGTQNIDDSRLAAEVFAGYIFNDYTAIEMGYRDLGAAEFIYGKQDDKVSVEGLSLSLISRLPVNNFVFSLEAGAMNYWMDSNRHGTDSDIMIYSGAAAEYKLSEQWSTAIKYRRYAGMENEAKSFSLDSNYVGLSLTYRFGNTVTVAKPAPAPVVVDADNDGIMDNVDQCLSTPSNYQVDATGCPLMVQTLKTSTIDVKFLNNSTKVAPESAASMQELAKFLEAHPAAKLTINGHSSLPGKAAYNQKLSEQRAQSVATELTANYGVAAERITTVGYGETQPLINAETAEANAANRRIDAVITMEVSEAAIRN